jgi:hypothetical protein
MLRPPTDISFSSDDVKDWKRVKLNANMLTRYKNGTSNLINNIFEQFDEDDETVFKVVGMHKVAGRETGYQVLFGDCGAGTVMLTETELLDWLKDSHRLVKK